MRKFDELCTIYSEINGDDDFELTTNRLAAFVAQGNTVDALALGKKNTHADSFEVVYNTACALIDNCDFKEAEAALEKASNLCKTTLESEDYSQEEIDNELAVMRVQLAYLYQVMNRSDEAAKLYGEVLTSKPSDAGVVAVASNNIVSLRKKDEKLFDSIKKNEKCLKTAPHKLTARLKQAALFNKCLLFVHGKKHDQAGEAIAELEEMYPGSRLPLLANVAVWHKQKKYDEAVTALQAFVNSKGAHASEVAEVKLTLAHIYLLQKNYMGAVDTLTSLEESNMPAIIATCVALCERANDVERADKILSDAVAYWEKNNGDFLPVLLEKTAEFKMKHGKKDDALKVYSKLMGGSKKGNQNAEFLAHAVVASAIVDVETAKKYASQLGDVPGVDGIDVDALINGPAPRAPVIKKSSAKTEKNADDEDGEEKKKPKRKSTKKRKPRYPKGFDPANPGPMPDAERWLPKYERSYFKKSMYFYCRFVVVLCEVVSLSLYFLFLCVRRHFSYTPPPLSPSLSHFQPQCAKREESPSSVVLRDLSLMTIPKQVAMPRRLRPPLLPRGPLLLRSLMVPRKRRREERKSKQHLQAVETVYPAF